MDESAFTASDDDLFPLCTEAGVLHLDEYGVVYVYDRVPGLGWVSLGPVVGGSG